MKEGDIDILRTFTDDREVRRHLKKIVSPQKIALLIAERLNPHLRLRQSERAFLAGVTPKTVKNRKNF